MKSTPKLPSSSRMQMPMGGGSVSVPKKNNGKATADVNKGGVSGGLVKAASKKSGMKKNM